MSNSLVAANVRQDNLWNNLHLLNIIKHHEEEKSKQKWS